MHAKHPDYSDYSDNYYSDRCPNCLQGSNIFPCPACGWQEGQDNEAPFLPLGTILGNSYRIAKVLGTGGFGVIYLAWEENLHFRLVIKEYFYREAATRAANGLDIEVYPEPHQSAFYHGLDSFLEEARLQARFDGHPGVVSVKTFFRANGTGYMVMEYMEGATMREYLGQCPEEKISFAHALDILNPVMSALQAMHDGGLLHRDVSPVNIYITKDERVKLLDFGAARFSMGDVSKSLSVLFKPGYAPEEQYRSRSRQGPWTDVYAVAATMYRAITGEVPHNALDRAEQDELAPPSMYGVDLSAEQEIVLMKGLAVRATDRFQSMAEFQQALQSIASQANIKTAKEATETPVLNKTVPTRNTVRSITGKATSKEKTVRTKTVLPSVSILPASPTVDVIPNTPAFRKAINSKFYVLDAPQPAVTPSPPPEPEPVAIPSPQPTPPPQPTVTASPTSTTAPASPAQPNVVVVTPKNASLALMLVISTLVTAGNLGAMWYMVNNVIMPAKTSSIAPPPIHVTAVMPSPPEQPVAKIADAIPVTKTPDTTTISEAMMENIAEKVAKKIIAEQPKPEVATIPETITKTSAITTPTNVNVTFNPDNVATVTLGSGNVLTLTPNPVQTAATANPVNVAAVAPNPINAVPVAPIPTHVPAVAPPPATDVAATVLEAIRIATVANAPTAETAATALETAKAAAAATEFTTNIATAALGVAGASAMTTAFVAISSATSANSYAATAREIAITTAEAIAKTTATNTAQEISKAAAMTTAQEVTKIAVTAAQEIANIAVTTAQAKAQQIADKSVTTAQTKAQQIADKSVITSQAKAQQIADKAIITAQAKAQEIANTAVTTSQAKAQQIADKSVITAQAKAQEIANIAVTTAQAKAQEIANIAVTTAQAKAQEIANTAVTTSQAKAQEIADKAVITSQAKAQEIANTAVTTSQAKAQQIADKSVITAQAKAQEIANTAVTTSQAKAQQIADKSVITAQAKAQEIANIAVTTAQAKAQEIANTAVTTAQAKAQEIANTAVTTAQAKFQQIADKSVITAQVKAQEIANTAVTTAQAKAQEIANIAVTTAQAKAQEIANIAVTTAQAKAQEIANIAVTTAQAKAQEIANTAVTTSQAKAQEIAKATIDQEFIKIAKVKPAIKPAEPAPEPAAEPAPEPAAEPAPEPAAEPAPEPAAEPAPEPAAEPAPEPAAESAAESAPAAEQNIEFTTLEPGAIMSAFSEPNFLSFNNEANVISTLVPDTTINHVNHEPVILTKNSITHGLQSVFAYKKPVKIKALMTIQERKEYKHAMKTAKTAEARKQIRELTYARLSQRATERGMFVVIPKIESPAHEPGEPEYMPAERIMEELNWTFAYQKPIILKTLMTKQERIEYTRAMQTARNTEARQQIRELTYARLSQRAKERGMFVTNHTNPTQPHEEIPIPAHELFNREPTRIKTIHYNGSMTGLHPVTAHPTHPVHPAHLPPRH